MIIYEEDMEITAPCYIKDMPADIYHRSRGASNSGLKLISRSPAHYKYSPRREATRNMVIGSALHMAVLEPELFYDTYKLLRGCEDRRSKDYKEAKEQFGEESVLVSSECAKVEGIMKSLWNDPEIASLLSKPGHNELSGFSIDPETGITCKHRFDKLLNSGIGIDLKTCLDARPDAFSRAIYNYNYHVQAAFYMDQYEWITGRVLTDFIFIAVESEAPYACKMYRLDHESLQVGRDTYRRALDQYAECKQSGIWPAYHNDGVEEISIPKWAFNYNLEFEDIENE